MSNCELCGKETINIIYTKISESKIYTCTECTKFGTIIEDNIEQEIHS